MDKDQDNSNGSGTKTISSRIETLTEKILEALETSLEDPELIPFKDLSSLVTNLMDRSQTSLTPTSATPSLTDATRGAVLGALEGLSSIAGLSLNRSSMEDRLKNVTPGKIKSEPSTKSLKEQEEADGFGKLI